MTNWCGPFGCPSRPRRNPVPLVLLLLACVAPGSVAAPPKAGRTLAAVEESVKRIKSGVMKPEGTIERLRLIDKGDAYLRDLHTQTTSLREEMHTLAHTYSGTRPVKLDDVRGLIDTAERVKAIIDEIQEIADTIQGTPEVPGVKDIVIGWAVDHGFELFLFFGKSLTTCLERLANGMHAANVQSMTLGELKEPVYPGLGRRECREVYEQIQKARALLRELQDVSRALSSGRSYLQRLRTAIEAVETECDSWTGRVADEIDLQLENVSAAPARFDSLAADMNAVINQAATDLGSQGVADYRQAVTQVVALAKEHVQEGVPVMDVLDDLPPLLSEAGGLLDAFEADGLDVAFERGRWQGATQDYHRVTAPFEVSTKSRLDPDAWQPRTLGEALVEHGLYGAGLTAGSIKDCITEMIEELRAKPAEVQRVTPATQLISLPSEITYPHAVPISVRVVNAAGGAVPGISVSFSTRGHVQITNHVVETASNGVVSTTAEVSSGIEENPAGALISAVVIAGGTRLETTYVFGQAGPPSEIKTVSGPQAAGRAGSRLPDLWMIQVLDADSNLVNNISLAVSFQALNGGSIDAVKSAVTVTGETVVADGEARFSAAITLGHDHGTTNRYRVNLTEPSGMSVSAEIGIRADTNSTYGTVATDLPTAITLALTEPVLAFDSLTEAVTTRSRSTPYYTTVHGVTVTPSECVHYKWVTNVVGGVTQVVHKVDFKHPYDAVSGLKTLAVDPQILGASHVKLDTDANTANAISVGRDVLRARASGMVGTVPAHPRCDLGRTIVQIGNVVSDPVTARVTRVRSVVYTCDQDGADLFNNDYGNIAVATRCVVADGHLTEEFHSRNYGRLWANASADIIFTPTAPYSDGVIRGQVRGTGKADLHAGLVDLDGKTNFGARVATVTRNWVSVDAPTQLRAGESVHLTCQLLGARPFGSYRCSWNLVPGLGNTNVFGSVSPSTRGFQTAGSGTLVSRTRFSYPETASEPFDSYPDTGDRWQLTVVPSGGGDSVINPISAGVEIVAPRLNSLYVGAKYANDPGDFYRAFGFDLFDDDDSERGPKMLELAAIGVFAQTVEHAYSAEWSLGGEEYKTALDMALSSGGTPLRIYNNQVDGYPGFAGIDVRGVRRPGTTTLSSRTGDGGIYSENVLEFRMNRLRLDYGWHDDVPTFQLVVEGPSEMYDYTNHWHITLSDDSVITNSSTFYRMSNGTWYAEIEEPRPTKEVETVLVNARGTELARLDMETDVLLTPVIPARIAHNPDTFTVDVLAVGVEDLRSYTVNLGYDPTLVETLSATQGPFLGSGGGSWFSATIDPTNGNVRMQESKYPYTDPGSGQSVNSVSGTGVLAQVTFRTLMQGQGEFDIDSSWLFNSGSQLIPLHASRGSLTIHGPGLGQTPVMAATTAPIVDGQLDTVWTGATPHAVANVVVVNGGASNNCAATWQGLWDEDYLYLAVSVKDEAIVSDSWSFQPWEDDSIDLYVDGDSSKMSVYDGINDFHLTWPAPGSSNAPSAGANSEAMPTGILYAAATTTTGYMWEAAIPWSALDLSPHVGARFSLEVQVNDDDDGGTAEASIAWSQAVPDAWETPSALGSMILADTAANHGQWRDTLAALAANRGLPPGAADPLADPDGNGWVNVMEYALGMTADQALTPDGPGDALFTIQPTGGGAEPIDLVLPYTGREDIEYVLRNTASLLPLGWSDAARKAKHGTWVSEMPPGEIRFHEEHDALRITLQGIAHPQYWRLVIIP